VNVLRDKETGATLGRITDAQLKFLTDQLEEESETDTDYYLNKDTLELLVEEGIDPKLLELLRQALGNREDMEIEWIRE
jgi:processive 1,2-diacylglycerol beta-glucosyltransferase